MAQVFKDFVSNGSCGEPVAAILSSIGGLAGELLFMTLKFVGRYVLIDPFEVTIVEW